MTTNNSIIFRAEYQEMLDGLRKIEPAWESVQKALKELNQQYPGANPLVADENRRGQNISEAWDKLYYLLKLYTSED
jgi:hypothetical protein